MLPSTGRLSHRMPLTNKMTEIQNSIDKKLIAGLPQIVFYGDIMVIDTLQAAEEAVAELSSESIVGFDTETKPSFKKGVTNKVALLQLSTLHKSYLFRLNLIGIPDCLARFLANPEIRKIGLSIKDDFNMISGRSDVKPQGFVELQEFVPSLGIQEKGLQRIYALLFGRKISKAQQLSNWEAESLTPAQQQYASIDAWACLEIYRYLCDLKRKGNYQIIKKYAAEESLAEKG